MRNRFRREISQNLVASGSLATLLISFAPSIAEAQFADCGGIINNGIIQMGVNCEGHLNVPYDGDPLDIGYMGLRYMPTGAASTEPGCLCEGWGLADPISGVTGHASMDEGGATNITTLAWEQTGDSARSTVHIGSTFRVTHDYHPSPNTPNLYEVSVTVTNISSATVNALYRRVMDWDIYPTPFDEYVTIVVGSASELYRTDTNGFNSANPFSFSSYEAGPV